MIPLSVAFDRPGYLWLLCLLPAVWWLGWNNIRGLAGARHWLALLFRSAVVILFVLALAELQLVRITDRVATFFLLDQSLSVPRSQRDQYLDYASVATLKHRNAAQGDLAGVITFGRESEIEQPLIDDALVVTQVDSSVDPRHSNIQSALRLARSAFPEGAAKRVVLVSDGNQNVGDALTEGHLLVRDGIGIDVAMLPSMPRPDVILEKLTVRSSARIGSPFDMNVVITNYQENSRVLQTSGRIQITRKVGAAETLVAEQPVTLEPGKHVFTFPQELNEPGFYSYKAQFVADDSRLDHVIENNEASAFTQVHGRGRILFIVNSESPDEFQHLIQTLEASDIEVTVRPTHLAFSSLVELQEFDGVVLANTPRVTSDGQNGLTRFSDDQIRMLVRNVESMGAGLVMIGGPESFGAGGWANTELEKAMPVDFQVKNAEVRASGALMIVIDKSGSMSGLKLQMSKAAAQAAVDMLGSQDHVGVVAFDSNSEEVVRLQQVGQRRERIKFIIDRIGEGGGTSLQPAMRKGYARLLAVEASVKHMIVLTDGQTPGEAYDELASKMRKQGITTTSVAVGPDAARNLLLAIANHGGGKYYQVISPRAIPQIFMHETKRVLRPLVFESDQSFRPQIVATHEVLRGIGSDLPPITGYVLTTAKQHPLVELVAISPKPTGQTNPLFATWTYGLGRTGVFTSDAGQRWTRNWTEWESYDKFFVQFIRWSMRPVDNSGEFNVTTETQDGKLRVMVHALTSDGEFINNLPIEGRLSGTKSDQAISLHFKQIAPGGYLAECEAVEPGSYLISILPGRQYPLVRSGVDVPGYREFRDRQTNEHVLTALAGLKPAGGEVGEVMRLPEDPNRWSRFAGANIFRRTLPFGRLLTSVWPATIVIASVLFFVDVANRRLLFANPLPVAAKWIRSRVASKQASNISDERLERLRSQKFKVQTESQPFGERLGSASDFPCEDEGPTRVDCHPPETTASSDSEVSTPDAESLDYTQRLLRAKRFRMDNKS